MKYIQKGIEILVVIGILVGCYLMIHANYKYNVKRCVSAGYDEVICIREARK